MGFDDVLRGAIRARNIAFREHYVDAPFIETQRAKNDYDAKLNLYLPRKVGTCAGLDGDACPYTTQLDESNMLLRTESRDRGKDWRKVLVRDTRCYLCLHVRQNKNESVIALREFAGKCMYNSTCEEKVGPGERLCLKYREDMRDASEFSLLANYFPHMAFDLPSN